ncbi:MAG: hypothetical protein ACPHSD_19710 [Candidatus Latescibacterota bacterium]
MVKYSKYKAFWEKKNRQKKLDQRAQNKPNRQGVETHRHNRGDLTMTFTHTFDDRDENGPDLTVEVEVETGYAGTLECPAVEADIVIGNITDADGNQYDEDFFTAQEWANIENAAEAALEAK